MTPSQELEVFLKLAKKVEKNYKIDFSIMPPTKIIEYKIYYKFIFDHDFQKALWGNLWIDKDGKALELNNTSGFKKNVLKLKARINVNMANYKPAYLHYAQQLALADDYLEFLKKFV